MDWPAAAAARRGRAPPPCTIKYPGLPLPGSVPQLFPTVPSPPPLPRAVSRYPCRHTTAPRLPGRTRSRAARPFTPARPVRQQLRRHAHATPTPLALPRPSPPAATVGNGTHGGGGGGRGVGEGRGSAACSGAPRAASSQPAPSIHRTGNSAASERDCAPQRQRARGPDGWGGGRLGGGGVRAEPCAE